MKRSDPTANRAIGAVSHEWEEKLCLAYRFRSGFYQIDEPGKVFFGIYRRLLTDDPIEELEKETHRIEKEREKKRKRRHPG